MYKVVIEEALGILFGYSVKGLISENRIKVLHPDLQIKSLHRVAIG
jgi:hypothetical protein